MELQYGRTSTRLGIFISAAYLRNSWTTEGTFVLLLLLHRYSRPGEHCVDELLVYLHR